jgi:uncharacterized glyoxalase superfamily protein PhnB
MRLVRDPNYDDALHFYRDVLGAQQELQIHGEDGEKVTILQVGWRPWSCPTRHRST